ncbi:256_t:CDS:2 [Funneliformis geosporum]|nr:256_t:CDS:2 [Funneliformis geosporum]
MQVAGEDINNSMEQNGELLLIKRLLDTMISLILSELTEVK